MAQAIALNIISPKNKRCWEWGLLEPGVRGYSTVNKGKVFRVILFCEEGKGP